MHAREGAWPKSLTSSMSVAESDLALYHHEPHMEGIEYRIWAAYGTATLITVGTYEGVPIVGCLSERSSMNPIRSQAPCCR